jgi:hypothetical protein
MTLLVQTMRLGWIYGQAVEADWKRTFANLDCCSLSKNHCSRLFSRKSVRNASSFVSCYGEGEPCVVFVFFALQQPAQNVFASTYESVTESEYSTRPSLSWSIHTIYMHTIRTIHTIHSSARVRRKHSIPGCS